MGGPNPTREQSLSLAHRGACPGSPTETLGHGLVIVGGGAAGLRAAIAAAEADPKLDIALVSKVYPMRSHTVSAEGGAAAAVREYDGFDQHAFDTIKGSDYLADQDAVEFFVRRAPEEVIRLEHWGCPWSRDWDGRTAVRAFGGMTVKRTLYAADKTGFHLLHTLFQTSLRYENIVRLDEWFVTSLIVGGGRVHGVTALELKSGNLNIIAAPAVLLATGGCGRVYEFTTNASTCTGDGMALAYRAGAELKDMEFVQFHPTALPGTGILMTEGARGEGGYLINKDGERFLRRYVPSKMELGPRDLLSRAILTELHEGRGLEGPYGSYVLLDLRHLGRDVLERRLPFVKELAEEYVGVDPAKEPIPVRPAQHYMMGGVHTNRRGETNIAGFFAAGECACVSINGANRLGSNSLSECLVFGAEAGRAAAAYVMQLGVTDPPSLQEVAAHEEKRIFGELLGREVGARGLADLRQQMQRTMDQYTGPFRDAQGMSEAVKTLRELRDAFRQAALQDKDRVFNTELTAALELEMMLDVALVIATAALSRAESRGAHYRTDLPKRDDANYLAHSMALRGPEGPTITYRPVVITRWQPAERVY